MNIVRLLATVNDSCGKPICSSTSGIPNSTSNLGSAVSNFVNGGLILLGALSVVFVVVGALQYVVSGGNAGRTKQARETILYAIVGLVLAGSAYAIVSFLEGRL